MLQQIDIISDPNCPFCALGFLQLTKALEETEQSHVQIRWHPFLINPHLTPEGMDIRENLKHKYAMSDADIEASFDRFEMMGEPFGFKFTYPKDKRVYPSQRAHELLAFVPEDVRSQANLALMRKFFTESKNFYDLDVLRDVALELGLDADEAAHAIETGQNQQIVADEIQYWQSQGVGGVPGFIVNEKYFISGAIGVDGFKNMFQQLKASEILN